MNLNNNITYTIIRQLRSLVLVAWVVCVLILGYALLGDAMQGFGDRPELIPVEQQGHGRNGKGLAEDEKVVDGIHLATGMKIGKGFDIVRQTCTGCHSAKLITQNRATRTGWKEMITWMQETQGLWQLGPIEEDVLDYLSTYYAPEQQGRRALLEVDEQDWYWLAE